MTVSFSEKKYQRSTWPSDIHSIKIRKDAIHKSEVSIVHQNVTINFASSMVFVSAGTVNVRYASLVAVVR